MKNYTLTTGCLGYVTAEDSTNTNGEYIVSGSQNVIIDRQKKFGNRAGYSRLGVANTALTPPYNGYTWENSTGGELPVRPYGAELEVYLGTVDSTVINAWTRVKTGFSSTMMRFAKWWDATEKIDLLLYVIGDSTISEWSGGVAVVGSIPDGTHITKAGTTTWAQNRFLTTRDKVMTCVRTGTEYTYSAGETSTNLTVVDSTGLVAGDILVQKVIVRTTAPASGFKADLIFSYKNNVYVASHTNLNVYMSKNTSYYDFAFSAPRVAGEGELLTLHSTPTGFGLLSGKTVIFAGKNDRYAITFNSITVGAVLTESSAVDRFESTNQSAQSQELIVQVGEALAYLSFEPALHILESIDQLKDPKPKSVSSPIKPDFDAEDWTGAFMGWANSRIHISAVVNSRLYMLEYMEDAQGKTTRFWQPPQLGPFGALMTIDGYIHCHSNSTPETYKLFDTLADVNSSDEKLPIHAIAKRAYFNGGKRANLKDFDEYFVEGEISASTSDLLLTLNYEFGGAYQQLERTIDGGDADILFESLESTSLGQQSLGLVPIGGAINVAEDTAKFRVIFDIAKDDFHEMQDVYETNEIDRAWSILSAGPNARLSKRQNTVIHK